MYFTLETTNVIRKMTTYSYHMTGANCASDPFPSNVNGNVSTDVTSTRSIPAGESCVLPESVENMMESEYYALL